MLHHVIGRGTLTLNLTLTLTWCGLNYRDAQADVNEGWPPLDT